MPWMKYRWRKQNRSRLGTLSTVTAAMATL
jgi:hypothetical protein